MCNKTILTDITGMLARAEKLVATSEYLIEGEVYHYHTKLIMKEAHTGGAFAWYLFLIFSTFCSQFALQSSGTRITVSYEQRSLASHLTFSCAGYWYNNGCMFPNMITVFIALDPSVKVNGCLQVLGISFDLKTQSLLNY